MKKPIAWMKIYTPSGMYVASCNDAAAAAALMSFYGSGAEIRNGHTKKRTIWREGFEKQSAGESYDFVIEVINARISPPLLESDHEQDRRIQEGLEQTKATVAAMLASRAAN